MLNKIFIYNTDNTFVQLFRYTFVGGIAFIGDFGSLFIMTEYAKIYYLTSAAIAFIIGLTINYTLSVKWVFSKNKFKSRLMEFSLFSLIGVVGLGFNESIMWLLTEKAGLYYMTSKICTTGVVYLWNFFARKHLVFE